MSRRADGAVLLARGAARFDVSAETHLPPAPPARIAHQVRQDVWRTLRRLRGFAPVVSVEPDATGLRVTAGGAVVGAIPPGTAARIAAVLEHRGNRARWLAHARREAGMTGLSLIALAVVAALPALASEAPVALPSGRIVTFHDMIEAEGALRFRFLEPDLAMVVDFVPYASLEADMRYLCETFALDRLDGSTPSQIFISISDRPVDFGEKNPDVAQVFEAYRPENGACIWEGF